MDHSIQKVATKSNAMRRAWLAAPLLLLALSGCLGEDQTAGTDSNPTDSKTDDAVDPYHVDETFELMPEGMDESWSWTMNQSMTGRVTIEYIPDPVAASSTSICYELDWGTGRHYRCASGGVVLSVDGTNVLEPQTIYDVKLNPDDFDLRVWSGAGPDTANVHVTIDTWVKETT